MEMPSAVKLPAPSGTFLERQKKRFAAKTGTVGASIEDAAEDAEEAIVSCWTQANNGLKKCCARLGVTQKCVKRTRKNVVDGCTVSHEKQEHFYPPFPVGIIVCTALIAVGGALILTGWGKIDAHLDEWELKTADVLEEFYASAAEADLKVANTYSVDGIAATRLAVTSVIEKLVLYVCVGGTVAGAILSLHSLAVRAAFKNKAIDSAFELNCIPSVTGQYVVRELCNRQDGLEPTSYSEG